MVLKVGRVLNLPVVRECYTQMRFVKDLAPILSINGSWSVVPLAYYHFLLTLVKKLVRI
jgi:hypothetical protein